jgi:GntR family transcriptional regulator/MocR family aminotransferase
MDLTPRLDETSKQPLYVQLYTYIKEEIESGRLPSSTRLPSVRSLAKYLNIGKNTVEACYHQLLAEGYIESKLRSGFYVLPLQDGFFEGMAKAAQAVKPTYEKQHEIGKYVYDFVKADK